MNKKEIARIFDAMADMLEIRGEVAFKCIAYHNAARTLETIEEPIEDLVAAGRLTELKGIGKSMAEKIAELVGTGKCRAYEVLAAEIPEGVRAMLVVEGLGPKKIKTLYEELGIKSVDELEAACLEGRLVALPKFGEKTQQNILRALRFRQKQTGRFHVHKALELGAKMLEHVRTHKKVLRSEAAGSLRRRKEVIGDIDLLASSEAAEEVMKHFLKSDEIEEVLAHGPTKSSVRLYAGIQVDLRIVSDEQFPFALAYFTGSKEHNTTLRGRAKKMGLKMNEYGLFPEGSDRSEPCADEAAIYRRLGLPYIEPELRENMGEIEAAERGQLPDLVRLEDIVGLVHVHSDWSDGAHSLADWAEIAHREHFEYVAVCDHSKSAAYAGGMPAARVREQHKEIDRLNARGIGVPILKGIEVDVLADGSLDYDDKLMSTFDLVIASIHSRFNLSRAEQTERLARAAANPFVHMLGHPTGRLLLSREGYDVDMEAVIDTAARHGTMIEINANPLRLDLDWRPGITASRKGVRTSVNPDAHDRNGIGDIAYGVGIARKGWFAKSLVANALPLSGFLESLKKR
jgi:DNA polymerase (family 10)